MLSVTTHNRTNIVSALRYASAVVPGTVVKHVHEPDALGVAMGFSRDGVVVLWAVSPDERPRHPLASLPEPKRATWAAANDWSFGARSMHDDAMFEGEEEYDHLEPRQIEALHNAGAEVTYSPWDAGVTVRRPTDVPEYYRRWINARKRS